MQECRKEKVLVIEGWVLTEEGEQKRTLQEKGPPRLSTNTHANIAAIPRACCLLAHYPGSKQQRLEADRTGGVIICGGKLHHGIMFVHWWSWQNGGLIHFKKWRNLFPWRHYVRYFVTLTHGGKKKKFKVGRKWIEASVGLQAWRYRRDPHDWCPFPHHYSNSHGCNWLNWAIDFILAASFHPTN